MFSFNWLGIIWRGGVRLKFNVQGQGGEGILDLDGQRGRGGILKIGNFHGGNMCIIPKWNSYTWHETISVAFKAAACVPNSVVKGPGFFIL